MLNLVVAQEVIWSGEGFVAQRALWSFFFSHPMYFIEMTIERAGLGKGDITENRIHGSEWRVLFKSVLYIVINRLTLV